jgi:hypothetical protein
MASTPYHSQITARHIFKNSFNHKVQIQPFTKHYFTNISTWLDAPYVYYFNDSIMSHVELLYDDLLNHLSNIDI